MNDFSMRVHEWQLFYATIMGSSATLLGLLFFAVSLNKSIISHKENLHLKKFSRQTFGLFVSVISISLTLLIPGLNPMGMGIPLTCIGTAGLIAAVRESVSHVRSGHWRGALRHYGWPCVAFGAIITASLHVIFFLDSQSLYLVMAGMIMLLISATRSTWFLLMELHEI